MARPPPIAVVVLQYGRPDLTIACIADLRLQTVPVEVVLVEGGTPGLAPLTRQHLATSSDTCIQLERNLGYAGANNVALRLLLARPQPPACIALLNNDTSLAPDCLERLAHCLHQHPRAAQAVPSVRYPDGRFQALGGDIVGRAFEPRLRGHLRGPPEAFASPVRFAPGMCVLVRTTALREVGLLPETYFLYGEDVDWSLAFAAQGWEVWAEPAARIVHHESVAAGGTSFRKGRWLFRSNVWLARRWLRGIHLAGFHAAFAAKVARQAVRNLRHPAYAAGLCTGWLEGIFRPPRAP